MRIAVHAPTLAAPPIGEAEQLRRLEIACARRGWALLRAADTAAIEAFGPDLVLAEGVRVPKLTPVPTLGLMSDPLEIWDGGDQSLEAIVSWDGHLFADPDTRRQVRDLVAPVPARFVEGRWFPSCPSVPLPTAPRDGLAWLDIERDGPRDRDILVALARQGGLQRYGLSGAAEPPGLPPRRVLPADGESVVRELGRRAAALCRRSRPRRAGAPCLQALEAAMAGAIVIADRDDAVGEAFGEAALYVGGDGTPEQLAAEVARHMAWIAAYPQAAEAMRAAAHRIVVERFSYDALLEPLPALVAAVRAAWAPPPAMADQVVTCILRSGGRDLALLDRALVSLEQQSHAAVRALVVAWRDAESIRSFVARRAASRLLIRVIDSPDTGCRSTALWNGLAAVDTPFFAVLDDDDTLMPNHLAAGLATLSAYPNVDLAYSGTVEVDESRSARSLLWFAHFEPIRFRVANTIASHAWVARARLLPSIGDDPEFVVGEDYYLLLRFACVGHFAPTWRLTAEYRRRDDDPTHSALAALPASLERIRRRFHFAPVRPEGLYREAVGEDAARILKRLIRRRQFRKGLTLYLRDIARLPARLAALPGFLSERGVRGLLRRIADRGVGRGR